jgi:hypothetical protein
MQKQSIAISDTRAPVSATLFHRSNLTVDAHRTRILPAGHHRGECRLRRPVAPALHRIEFRSRCGMSRKLEGRTSKSPGYLFFEFLADPVTSVISCRQRAFRIGI